MADTALLDDTESIVGGCKYIPLCTCSGSTDRESQAENAVFAAAEREGEQLAVIVEHDGRADTGSAMSTGKMDPHVPGWTKRIGVGNHPPERTPCSERVCALEKTISTRRSWVSMLLSAS